MGIGLHASDASCFSAIVVDFPRINGRPGAAELYNQRFAAEPYVVGAVDQPILLHRPPALPGTCRDKCVRPGMYLAYIEDQSLENLPYSTVCTWLRAATRPVTLTFLALEPEESMEAATPHSAPVARPAGDEDARAGPAGEDSGEWERRCEAVQAELASQAAEWEKRENELVQQADEAKARQEQLASELQMQRELYENKLYALAGKYQRLKTAFAAVRDEAARNQQQCDTLTDQLRRMREVGVGRQRKSSVVMGLVAERRGSVTTVPKGRLLPSVEETGEEKEAESEEEGTGVGGEEAEEQLEAGVDGDDAQENGGKDRPTDGDASPDATDDGEADRGHQGEEDAPDAPEPQDPADEKEEEGEGEGEEEEMGALRSRVSELEAQLASALESMEAMAKEQRVSARRTSMKAVGAVDDAEYDWAHDDYEPGTAPDEERPSGGESEGEAENGEGGGAEGPSDAGEESEDQSERRADDRTEEESAQGGERASVTEDGSSGQQSPARSVGAAHEVEAAGEEHDGRTGGEEADVEAGTGEEAGTESAETATGRSDVEQGQGQEEVQEAQVGEGPMPPPSVPPPSAHDSEEGTLPAAALDADKSTAEERGQAASEDAHSSSSAQATISSLLSQLADARERAAHAEEQLADEQRRSEDLERQLHDLKQQVVRLRATSKFKDAIFERRMSTLNPVLQGTSDQPSGDATPEEKGGSKRKQPHGSSARPTAGPQRADSSSPPTRAASGAAAGAAKPAGAVGAAQKRTLVYKVFGGGIRHSGWLLKTSAVKKELIKSKRWRKRWCAVESGMMSYYESSDSQAPKGTIQLASQGVEVSEKGQAQFTISVEDGAKVYTFMSAGSSHDAMREDTAHWVRVLREIVDGARALGVSKTAGLSGGQLDGQGAVAASTSVIPKGGAPATTQPMKRRLSYDGRKRGEKSSPYL